MNATHQEAFTRLSRNRDRSLSALARKGAGYLAATVCAALLLRACDSVSPGAEISAGSVIAGSIPPGAQVEEEVTQARAVADLVAAVDAVLSLAA